MNIAKYLAELKNMQENFLEFLEDEGNIEENLNNLKIKITDMKILDNKHDFNFFIYFISYICSNYCHNPTFYIKIEQTLQFFKEDKKGEKSQIIGRYKQNLFYIIKL